MITKLSGVRRFVVRPTSSVLRFAGNEEPFAVGRELSVDFVLDGTIRRAGERIRISAQLLDVNSNSTRWAESFDEKFTDVLELEDTVAEKVAKILTPKLTGEEQQKLAKRGTNKPEAFEAYLRGRYHLSLFTPDDFARAKNYFEQAIALDSEYAMAYVALADYYFVLGTFADTPPTECYEKARETAERAIALDATLGEAHSILGFTYLSDFDLQKVEKKFAARNRA
jgi:tetratricopeptide (TPR) repeat protein